MQRESLFQAFVVAPRPSCDEITEHRCEECDGIREQLQYHENYNVPEVILEQCFDSLQLLSKKAWRYFLPSYLDYALKNPESDLASMLIINLDFNSDPAKGVGDPRAGMLAPVECAAIAIVLSTYRSVWAIDPEEVLHRKLISSRYRALAGI